MKIAVSKSTPTGVPLDPECVAALDSTIALLLELGHEVVDEAPPIDGAQLSQAFLGLWMAGTTHDLEIIGSMRGKPVTEGEVEPLTWAASEMGKSLTAPQYMAGVRFLHSIGRLLGRFFERYDAWLTPTLAKPPLPLGSFLERP